MSLKTVVYCLIAFLLVSCLSGCGKPEEKEVPISVVEALPQNITAFLKDPVPGMYWIPENIKYQEENCRHYNVLNVTKDKQVFLFGSWKGSVNCRSHNAMKYIPKLPEAEMLKSVIGSKITVEKVNLLFGIPGNKTHHLLFTIDGEELKVMGLMTVSTGGENNVDYKYADIVNFSGYDIKKDGLRGSLWLRIKDGKISFFPNNVYGNPLETLRNKNGRLKIPYSEPREIKQSFSDFLKSPPEAGLYRIPENIVMPELAPYQGIYVTENKKLLLCPALKSWDENNYFYEDQCYFYLPALPSVRAIRETASSKGVKLEDFIEKLHLGKSIIKEENNATTFKMFTYAEPVIYCKLIDASYINRTCLRRVWVENKNYNLPDKEMTVNFINMFTGKDAND